MDLSVEISDEALEGYGRVNKKHSKWVIFKADEKKEKVLLESEGGLESTFDDFRDALPDNEPRWAAYDLKVEKADGSTAKKIVFICYVPDTYYGTDKLFFSAAKEAITKHFDGIARNIQANDKDDVNEKEFIELFL